MILQTAIHPHAPMPLGPMVSEEIQGVVHVVRLFTSYAMCADVDLGDSERKLSTRRTDQISRLDGGTRLVHIFASGLAFHDVLDFLRVHVVLQTITQYLFFDTLHRLRFRLGYTRRCGRGDLRRLVSYFVLQSFAVR